MSTRHATPPVRKPPPDRAGPDDDDGYDEEGTVEEVHLPMSAGRKVLLFSVFIGTAFAIMGPRLIGLHPAVAGWAATWAVYILLTAGVIELFRRRRREMARGVRRHSLTAASTAGRSLRDTGRWLLSNGKKPPPEEEEVDGPFAPVWVTYRSKSGRPLNRATGAPVLTVKVDTADELAGRLDFAQKDADLQVTMSSAPPPSPPPAAARPPAAPPAPPPPAVTTTHTTEGTSMDTHVAGDPRPRSPSPGRARARGRSSARPTGSRTVAWKQVAGDVADYEPDTESELLNRLRIEVNGMAGYAEGVIELYETCVDGKGLDPAALRALHDVADAAATAADTMADARKKYMDYYDQVRQFVGDGGILADDGKFHDGDDDVD